MARYPSSFSSYCQAGPSGSFSTARQSIGSTNHAVMLSAFPVRWLIYFYFSRRLDYSP
jgi:hypothetical protein